MAALAEADAGDRDPRVALHRCPDRQRHPAGRAQHSPRLGERRRGIWHQHVAEPAEHTVDRVVVERDVLGVDHSVVDVPEAELGTAAAGGVEHRRREVAGDQSAAPTDDLGRLEAGVADPGRKLEDRISLLWIELAQHPLADRRRNLLDLGPPLLPGRRDLVGDLDVDLVIPLALVFDRLVGHPVLPARPTAQRIAERPETNPKAGRAAAQSGVLPMRRGRAPSRTGSPRHGSTRRSCRTRSGRGGRRS